MHRMPRKDGKNTTLNTNSKRAFMKLLSMAALGALAMLCAIPAKAGVDAIDCSSTGFALDDAAYTMDCERVQGSVRADEASGQSTVDVASVSNEARTLFLTMVDSRITAPRIYLEYRNLGEGFRSTFKEDGVRDWKAIGKKDGYDVAEFSQTISGHDSRCIAVQRYSNAMYTGYKRHLIGMGCTVGDLEEIYQILRRMDAPGD